RTGKLGPRPTTGNQAARKSVRTTPGAPGTPGASGAGAPAPPAAGGAGAAGAKRSTMVRGPQPPAGGARAATSGRGTGTARTPRGPGGPSDGGSKIAGAGGDRPQRDFRVRRSGMSLSVKFMLIVSGMVASLMVMFFLTVFIITSKAVDDEINANGAAQAKALGNLCRVYVQTIFNPRFMDALLNDPAVRAKLNQEKFPLIKDALRKAGRPHTRKDFNLNAPWMERFQLGKPNPVYTTVDEVVRDIARGLICVGGFTEPDLWDARPGSAFFRAPDDESRLVDELRAWLKRSLTQEELSSFNDTPKINQFREMRSWSSQYLDAAQKLITDSLQEAYHDIFLAAYVGPLVSDEIAGVSFTRIGEGASKNEQFAVPDRTRPLEGGHDVSQDVKIAEGNGIVQFGYRVVVEIVGDDASADVKNFGYFAAVQFNADRVNGARNRLVMFLAAIALLAIVIGICVSYFMANSVTKPINTLVEDVIHIAQGEYEHRTRMKTMDEVGVLARTIDRMAEGLLEAREIAKERGKQQHEMSIAEEVVIHLLPDSLPKIYGYDVYAFYNPSKEVGGDYYDFFEIDPNHVGMIVADVSGKGIPGAMVMTMARSVIRYEAMGTLSPRETFMRANRHIARDIKRGMFVTAFYVVLNTQTAEMTVASAGHNPLLLWRASTGKVEMVNPNGIALGFDKGPIFDRTIKEDKVQLYSGDRVVLYTDGVVEAMSPDNEEYTDERFIELIESYPDANSNQLTNIIVQDVMDHQGGGEQSDDITIVTFKLL
ncbi:MAG: PP2C family protein-serine/threonine phosphatase, partial [Planctomycetota bacterium]